MKPYAWWIALAWVGIGRAQEQTPPPRTDPQIYEYLQTIWNGIVGIWRFQLTAVDDRPITVGKIILGVLLLVVGFWMSRALSRSLGKRLFRKVINENAAVAFESLAFYVFVVIFAMLALELVNVPLTIFTLLGGALAIGIGFGSQNLMNNFISGLIIMAERPIRIGDLIQLGDLYGTVVAIGTRSTRVRTGTNVDIIVPNSSFLQQNVINWTLGDDKVRTHITVGVVYGSPTETVRDLLLQPAAEHERVLKEPDPFVMFMDFGDNALIFEVHFWIRMKTQLDRKRIESEIRFRIDALAREHHIVIAFPQRDLHLDTVKPLEIRLLEAQGSAGGSPPQTTPPS